jgi:hypothetical protein
LQTKKKRLEIASEFRTTANFAATLYPTRLIVSRKSQLNSQSLCCGDLYELSSMFQTHQMEDFF